METINLFDNSVCTACGKNNCFGTCSEYLDFEEQMRKIDSCWYCGVKDEDLVFSSEFDTPVHIDCIKNAYMRDHSDREARIFYRELVT